MSTSVKALTIWQPYAELILSGSKQCETRGWTTSHRGPLLLHAAKRYRKDERGFTRSLFEHGYVDTDVADMPLGAIVGVCCVERVWPAEHPVLEEEASPYERRFGDFRPGRFAWELSRVRRLEEPIPWRGQQRLWNVPFEELPKTLALYCEVFAE